MLPLPPDMVGHEDSWTRNDPACLPRLPLTQPPSRSPWDTPLYGRRPHSFDVNEPPPAPMPLRDPPPRGSGSGSSPPTAVVRTESGTWAVPVVRI